MRFNRTYNRPLRRRLREGDYDEQMARAIGRKIKKVREYFEIASFPSDNKQNSIYRYYGQSSQSTRRVLIKGEVRLTEEEYAWWSRNLLYDIKELEKYGGTVTEGDSHYLLGLKVFTPNAGTFVIDSQGYPYARYIGL